MIDTDLTESFFSTTLASMIKVKKTLYFVLFFLLVLQLSCNLPIRSLPFSRPTLPDLLAKTSQEEWAGWIRRLSGAEGVIIRGEPSLITTRYDYAMFTGQPNARAFDYVLEQAALLAPYGQIEVDPYPYTDAERTYTWKNLSITLPGITKPQELIVLSAHLDSIVTQRGNSLEAAPGADDNATGVATLLQGLHLFPRYRFERSIRLIFFSGEELGLAGSRAYLSDHDSAGIVGVINMDMFGYDSNGDRCFELHVGNLPASDMIGRSFTDTIHTYGLNLHYDYLTSGATDRSDHTAFWEENVGAVTAVQNFFDNKLPDGCADVDGTPYYHKPEDTIDKLNLSYGFDIARAALLTTARLAGPLD